MLHSVELHESKGVRFSYVGCNSDVDPPRGSMSNRNKKISEPLCCQCVSTWRKHVTLLFESVLHEIPFVIQGPITYEPLTYGVGASVWKGPSDLRVEVDK